MIVIVTTVSDVDSMSAIWESCWKQVMKINIKASFHKYETMLFLVNMYILLRFAKTSKIWPLIFVIFSSFSYQV